MLIVSNTLSPLAAFIAARIKSCFSGGAGGFSENGLDVHFEEEDLHTPLGHFFRHNDIGEKEQTLLLLALAPHLQPDFYDRVIAEALPQASDFPQLGGTRGKNFRDFLPTVETALFLLAREQMKIMFGNQFTNPFGQSMHGGDWGAGRVPLRPIAIKPGPKGCGNTSARSGFYLHGGVMPGSSGCIDVGNSGFRNIAQHLQGYKGKVTVQIKYTQPAPKVNSFQQALGRFTYPGGESPTLWQRISSFFGGGSRR